jgi:carbonyl reductase 1/carbonyl reductase 3
LVNNAGTALGHGVEKLDIVKTNFYGTISLTEQFIPLLQDKGRIVNVSSIMGEIWLNTASEEVKKFMVEVESVDALVAFADEEKHKLTANWYGFSKTCMTAYG